MASCDDDPRLINKVTRTPGRNISKLKRFFDSHEIAAVDSDGNGNHSPKNTERKTSSSLIHSQENQQQKIAMVSDSPSQTVDYCPDSSERSQNITSANDGKGSAVCDAIIDETSPELLQVRNMRTEIPYCRKVASGDLWKNVDIGIKNENSGLWSSTQVSESVFEQVYEESTQVSNSLEASTAELNSLIAVSRAELSKKKEPSVSDKSNLENYFTSFENSKPKRYVPSNDSDSSFVPNGSSEFQHTNDQFFHSPVTSSYDCDIDELTFEDEDATVSDTSSEEEEARCNPSTNNTHYLPAYALHTIIEESCEESERDSRAATPTNDAVTSKLERYFSWDIINDTECDLRKKDDDESIIYSDSLSEASGSLSGDGAKEIDPTHLASSRLEKYFTSGLVGNENYFYPDDAEFLDDASVSDFEEDSIHQKISRSALLSSLETKPTSDHEGKGDSGHPKLDNFEDISVQSDLPKCEESVTLQSDIIEECNETLSCNMQEDVSKAFCEVPVPNAFQNVSTLPKCVEEPSTIIAEKQSRNYQCIELSYDESKIRCEEVTETCTATVCEAVPLTDVDNNLKNSENEIHSEIPCGISVDIDDSVAQQKQVVNKDQLANDVQAIIKKLLMYFSDATPESFKDNVEIDYISAWQLLETEIERLMQSISPTASLENNSCNSSTIDSNNSDYGSDTIESIDCMTDDDDGIDARNRINTKCPLVDFLSSAYKISPEYDLGNYNISDETLRIWKRLIQSLQKDNVYLSQNKNCDPSSEARLYIRDQIITLMHTVTVNETSLPSVIQKTSEVLHDKMASSPLDEDKDIHTDLNEAFNVSIDHSNILSKFVENETSIIGKAESSDEGISIDSSEHLNSSSEISSFKPQHYMPPDSISNGSIKGESPENSEGNDNHTLELPNASLTMILDDPVNLKLDSLPLQKVMHSKEKDVPKCVEKSCLKDSELKFSVFVDIELGDEVTTITERKPSRKRSSLKKEGRQELNEKAVHHLQVSEEACTTHLQSLPQSSTEDRALEKENNESLQCIKETHDPERSYRDTGYCSYKSSDDSLLNASSRSEELLDVPNFKSLKRSVKKFPVSNTLSKSTNNIHQTLSVSEAKFSTLQLKSQKSKVSMNPSSSPSRQFTSLFSPSAVFKRFTSSKSSETQSAESSIPAKYLKKYARSSSVDNEVLFGAASMPHLNGPKPGDSYSALGLYTENDRDSSLTLDDDMDLKPYSQSVLSLGSHSASMTSVYSAAGCHYGYVTVSGDALFGLNYNQKSQMMEVFVKQCRNLAACDVRHNTSNPYVKVYLLPDKRRSGKRKTKTKKNTLNPIFNELLRFPVLKHELESRTLWLSVWNNDLFGRNDFLGEITLPLGYRLLDSPTLRWYSLQERVESLTSPLNYKGELFLALKYVPRDLSLESRFRPAPVISLRGALHILVKEARNISANRSKGALDAFCKSYLLPDKSKSSKQKTPIVKKSKHPKWYYTVIYEDMSVDELKERSLELTVWDHDKLSSNEFMGGVRLNIGSGLYHGVSVEWMDARRDEAALWQAMLESPNMWVDGCLPLRPAMQFCHG